MEEAGMRIGLVHPARSQRAAWWRASVLVGALVSAACTSAPFRSPAPASSDRAAAVHLLNRATYGARPEDIEALLRTGARAWLERQFQAPRTVAKAPPSTSAQPAASGDPTVMMLQPGTPQPLRVNPAQAIAALVHAKLERAIASERQLEEVMTDFWFNHFNVFYNKGQVRLALADYEQNAIRRHVFSRFEDMLIATAQHPAMLVYLDNFMSTVAPASPPVGQRRPRGGLNENYARELLELHTLGVDGGYTQQDVIEVARAFTGWGIVTGTTQKARPVMPAEARTFARVAFQFHPERHDTGTKVVLGQTLAAGRGIEDGLDVLRMLARHPSTAEHVATKLVRHFVADDAPAELVAELAAVFRKTDGDLRAVTRALFTADAFYDPAHYRAKTKRPFEFVASALRLTGARIAQSQALVQQLRAFGHLPYSEAAPTGYPTAAEEWLSAGAMMNRMRFAIDLVAGRVTGVQFPPGGLLGGPEQPTPDRRQPRTNEPADAADEVAVHSVATSVLQQLLPGVPPKQMEALIVEDLASQPAADRRAVTARVAALVLGSPEFQRY
jgi:uncharacterized protein (DUF1800 family)